MMYWNEVEADCASSGAGHGGVLSVETTSYNGFGLAGAGETVYIRSYDYRYYNGGWHALAYPNWTYYKVEGPAAGGGGGYTTIGGTGFSYTETQASMIPSNSWNLIGLYVWTQRTGYHFAWVDTNSGGSFGALYSQGGYCLLP